MGAQSVALQPDGEASASHRAFEIGARVQIHGLQKVPALNGVFGVVLRFDGGSGRFQVRKEVARTHEAHTVTVRAENLRDAPPHAD